jgi:peptidoglycan-N-acetylglucosamine deacetylase
MRLRATSTSRLVLSIDLDEWYHSLRWLDGEQAVSLPDRGAQLTRLYGRDQPIGEVVAPTRRLLELFARRRVRATFFVLGEMATWYPDLIREIAAGGHEIASHGLHHVDMSVLGRERFAADLVEARAILRGVTGRQPIGYRAPNLVFEPWATAVLESQGFVYDSSVCASRSIGGKYKGWSAAPVHPYRPSYDNVAAAGSASLVELPLPAFPLLRLSAGSGILTRILGYHWSATALAYTLRGGDTGYYLHPWEVAPRPPVHGSLVKAAIFYRRTGDWMLRAVDRLIARFAGRVITASEAAERFRERRGRVVADAHAALG